MKFDKRFLSLCSLVTAFFLVLVPGNFETTEMSQITTVDIDNTLQILFNWAVGADTNFNSSNLENGNISTLSNTPPSLLLLLIIMGLIRKKQIIQEQKNKIKEKIEDKWKKQNKK